MTFGVPRTTPSTRPSVTALGPPDRGMSPSPGPWVLLYRQGGWNRLLHSRRIDWATEPLRAFKARMWARSRAIPALR
ncbi:hypothetical protein [Streptomyces sp. NPDC018031]|uniref:hypothetical protein n=1 Tax=Streptomyces sp. NPDC018031 TaxID=3365033 RepID=UPI0037B092A0